MTEKERKYILEVRDRFTHMMFHKNKILTHEGFYNLMTGMVERLDKMSKEDQDNE